MCGITGVLEFSERDPEIARAAVERMCDAIAHRGPDDAGVWVGDGGKISLGHRRLAIVDLSVEGHQPMRSRCGKYSVVFNGEIYNHQILRERLADVSWRGHSDTETILSCLSHFGIDETIRCLVGMFALAIWDHEESKLTLVRDRFGEKPLYYGWLNSDTFVFASELGALRQHPKWQGKLNSSAIVSYLSFGYVPNSKCIYAGINKVAPGTMVSVSRDRTFEAKVYWSLANIAASSVRSPDPDTDTEAVDKLEKLLLSVIQGQMMSDVPIGASLSGGVDSATVVALMQATSRNRINTFTIGFESAKFNEAQQALAVARHLGTNHTELYLSGADALATVPRLATVYDEPFADSSQIPTFLISQLTRKSVTVSLTGDGGDEMFGGYNRYLIANQIWPRLDQTPILIRKMMSRSALSLSQRRWDDLCEIASIARPSLREYQPVGEKIHKFARSVLPAKSYRDMYAGLVSDAFGTADLLRIENAEEVSQGLLSQELSALVAQDWMSLADQLTYLTDDILVKVDRAAMSVGLETRAPFLDHRVAEFAWRLTRDKKIRAGTTKWVLRQVLYKYVPRSLIDRPKRGFAVPLAEWLRGPLKDWVDELLDPILLQQQGIFNVTSVRNRWVEHREGVFNWHTLIWKLVMFQSWYNEQRRN